MKKLAFFLLITFSLCAFANNEVIDKNFKVSLSWIKKQPKSYARDFFIIEYIRASKTSKKNAKIAFDLARNKKGRVKKAYNKRFKKYSSFESRCYKLKTKDLIRESGKCIAYGLSLYEASTLSSNELIRVINKLDSYKTLQNDLILMSSKDFLSEVYKTNSERFFRIYFKAGKKFRQKFNKNLSKKYLNDIAKSKRFNRFIRYTITNVGLSKIKKSLLNIKYNSKLDSRSLFFLSINAILHNNKNKAIEFLDYTYNKSKYQFDKDKVVFWKYLLTNELKYLKKVASSFDNNIYSLYAKEKQNIEVKNIIYDLPQTNVSSSYNTTNQFEWIKVSKDIKKKLDYKKVLKYINLFTSEETLPHYSYILGQFNRTRTQYFITPYKDIFSKFPIERQILMYAIGRQESRFIPSSISTATAQGIMQIMPFLSKEIAQQRGEKYYIYEQFNPKVNLTYANHHLNQLSRQFKGNPLFIAYAYNGGAGFANRQLKKGLFTKRGKYEPFLSMELIEYNETRKYGKKVLANYILYNNYLNEDKMTIETILKSLYQ